MASQTKTTKVRISVYRVGQNFGWSAALKLRNGRVLNTTATYPFEHAARDAAESMARRLGYAVVV